MAGLTALNIETHRDIRVITDRGAEYGENVHIVPVIADELRNLVLEYPVFLMRDPGSGQFGLVAMLGFGEGENLFLNGDQWDASYIPLHVRRQPFMVGLAGEEGQNPTSENTVITIDMDSRRVQSEQGERLFDEDGNWSSYLKYTNELLGTLVGGIETTDAFVTSLADRDLIEPARLEIAHARGETKLYEGLYTIHDEKLQLLDLDMLRVFHDNSYLHACHLMLASIGNVQKLINRKAKGLAADD